MAQGSPGQAIASLKQLQTMPETLHQQLKQATPIGNRGADSSPRDRQRIRYSNTIVVG